MSLSEAKDLYAAIQGDREAVLRIAHHTIPKAREKVEIAQELIREKHRTEWDEDARRREAYNGEYAPEIATNALSDIYTHVLGVTHTLPLALIADDEEAQVYSDLLVDHLLELVVILHNPLYRYAIVSQINPDAREAVDEYLTKIAREIWGTMEAVTSEGRITFEDFPPDTAAALEKVNEDAGANGGGR